MLSDPQMQQSTPRIDGTQNPKSNTNRSDILEIDVSDATRNYSVSLNLTRVDAIMAGTVYLQQYLVV